VLDEKLGVVVVEALLDVGDHLADGSTSRGWSSDVSSMWGAVIDRSSCLVVPRPGFRSTRQTGITVGTIIGRLR
jgi:hypothetical protein